MILGMFLLHFPQPDSDVEVLQPLTHLGDPCLSVSPSLVLAEGA